MEIKARFLLSSSLHLDSWTTCMFVTMRGASRVVSGVYRSEASGKHSNFAVIVLLSLATQCGCRCLMNWFFWSLSCGLLSRFSQLRTLHLLMLMLILYRCHLALGYICYHLWCYNSLKYDCCRSVWSISGKKGGSEYWWVPSIFVDPFNVIVLPFISWTRTNYI